MSFAKVGVSSAGIARQPLLVRVKVKGFVDPGFCEERKKCTPALVQSK